MRMLLISLILVTLTVCGCAKQDKPVQAKSQNTSKAPAYPVPRELAGMEEQGSGSVSTAWPRDWSAVLGQTVTLEGSAANAKVGALLLKGEKKEIWIDGLGWWPDGYYLGEGKGKRLRVTGTVIQRNDLPVFNQKEDEPVVQSMGAPPGMDLEQARRRFLLKDATWVVLD